MASKMIAAQDRQHCENTLFGLKQAMPAGLFGAYITTGTDCRRCWREKKVHISSVASGPSGVL